VPALIVLCGAGVPPAVAWASCPRYARNGHDFLQFLVNRYVGAVREPPCPMYAVDGQALPAVRTGRPLCLTFLFWVGVSLTGTPALTFPVSLAHLKLEVTICDLKCGAIQQPLVHANALSEPRAINLMPAQKPPAPGFPFAGLASQRRFLKRGADPCQFPPNRVTFSPPLFRLVSRSLYSRENSPQGFHPSMAFPSALRKSPGLRAMVCHFPSPGSCTSAT
jgi:hypothetical protein